MQLSTKGPVVRTVSEVRNGICSVEGLIKGGAALHNAKCSHLCVPSAQVPGGIWQIFLKTAAPQMGG